MTRRFDIQGTHGSQRSHYSPGEPLTGSALVDALIDELDAEEQRHLPERRGYWLSGTRLSLPGVLENDILALPEEDAQPFLDHVIERLEKEGDLVAHHADALLSPLVSLLYEAGHQELALDCTQLYRKNFPSDTRYLALRLTGTPDRPLQATYQLPRLYENDSRVASSVRHVRLRFIGPSSHVGFRASDSELEFLGHVWAIMREAQRSTFYLGDVQEVQGFELLPNQGRMFDPAHSLQYLSNEGTTRETRLPHSFFSSNRLMIPDGADYREIIPDD